MTQDLWGAVIGGAIAIVGYAIGVLLRVRCRR